MEMRSDAVSRPRRPTTAEAAVTALDSEQARALANRRWARRPTDEPYTGSFLDFLDATGRGGPSRVTWRVYWKAADGLPLDAAELELFARHTGREMPPTMPAAECWICAGRRAGKSEQMTSRATWRAVSFDRTPLQPGEVGVIPLIASDRAQARNSLGYLKGLAALPLVAPYVQRVLRDSVEFRTGVVVQVHTASFRATRGYTMVDAILEECAFYAAEDSANPDEEIANAIRPALITVPGSRLYGISSPYARRGILWSAYEQHFGRDDSDVLVWNADTLSLNPTVSVREIERAFDRDAAVAASEYGRDGHVAFRTDVERFLSVDAIDGVVNRGRPLELSPRPDVMYVGWADPSGGSQDSFVLALAHQEGERAVLDLVRERRPPFSPDAVCQEFAAVAKAYRVTDLSGDHYAGAWVVAGFARHGVTYRPSDKSKSDVYREVMPLINAGRVELPSHPTLRTQLANLERRVTRAGQDSIGAVAGAHDDVSDAACGALVTAGGGSAADNWISFMKAEVIRTGAPLPASATEADRAAARQRTVETILTRPAP
jgi:hypothetical protein